ncbi:MAG: hypothetical protein JWQ29_3407 [Phenylobacterium sp.]|jgi:hypothetical protein|nr:hypothetical protein [Phenylobacterium sp.]
MKAPAWLEFPLVVMRFVVVVALVMGAAIFALLLGMASGPDDIRRTVYPGPDRKVSVVEEFSHGGGAAGMSGSDTYLVGRAFGPPVELGEHIYEFRRWVDDQTVEVCGEVAGAHRSVRVIGEDGIGRSYRVIVKCPNGGGSELGHE